MPTNLPPEYYKVEKRFREAETSTEKIACLEEMISTVPHHKGTDHLRADLNKRLAKMRDAAKTQKGASRQESVFSVDREGAGRVILVGPPNVGKSALVAALTHATPQVSEAPFTTWAPAPGMMMVDDVQATTGYGGPVQKHFQFADRERLVGVQSFDPRNLPELPSADEPQAALPFSEGGDPPPPWGIAVTRHGRIARFSLMAHSEVSTRAGRRFLRVGRGDDGVVAVFTCTGGEWVSLASERGRALAFSVDDVNVLKAAGKGVMAMKLRPEDRIFAFDVVPAKNRGAVVTTERGRELTITPRRFGASRAGRGAVVLKRGRFVDWAREPVVIMDQPGEE